MYGHVHQDYFTLMKGKYGQVMSIAYVNPSIATYTSLNPTFRVYEMDPTTYDLLDYVQYSLNLTEANKKGVAEWKQSYRFTEYFGMPDLSIRSLEKLQQKMKVRLLLQSFTFTTLDR